MSVYLDTHVAVWLHEGILENLSREAMRQIEDNDLLISPMVLLEFEYLFEKKAISIGGMAVFNYLQTTFGINLCTFPYPAVAREALTCKWTRDPFDRIIVAQAQANKDSVLLTADTKIRTHYKRAVW